MKKQKTQERNKGITLIALVITIIVMLILVAVTISMAVNGGLFDYAGKAVGDTQNAIDAEKKLADGKIKVGDKWYASIDDYLNNNPITTGIEVTPTEITLIKKEAGADGEEVLTGTITASVFGMESEPTITWETSSNAVTLSSTTGKTVTVTAAGTENTEATVTAKCTYEGKEYTATSKITLEIIEKLSYIEAPKDTNGFLTANATYASGDYTAVIPKGFKVSETVGETEIATGLVIKDVNGNEFVWVPVTEDLGSSYSYSSSYSEPAELTSSWSTVNDAYDSQAALDYLYGTDYYDYDEDFNYSDEYAKMVEKVNEYNGFYIGRYETTIDSDGNIGSEYNTSILTAGNSYKNNSTTYYYRWHGLYYAQKNANVTGNGTDVQTAMIYSVLWDEAMDFIRTQKTAGNTTYDVDVTTSAWHQSNVYCTASGLEYMLYDYYGEATSLGLDSALNIWGLEGHHDEYTQEACGSDKRTMRGSGNTWTSSTTASSRASDNPFKISTVTSSRLILYIL